MKEEVIKMKREDWDYIRSYKKTPIQKKYLENQRIGEIIENNRQYHRLESKTENLDEIIYNSGNIFKIQLKI